jgi:uncharacterized protein involved in type VI secretion and phage assembly
VTKNAGDPESLGRIQVRFDWETDNGDGANQCWVDVLTPYAGQDANTHGFLMLPEVGEQVLVRFIEPWDDKPIIVGSLRRGKVVDNMDTGRHKTLCTPGGNCIDLVSNQNSETIRLRAGQSDQYHLVLKTEGNRTTATMECNDDLLLRGKAVTIEGDSVKIGSKGLAKITAGGQLSLLSTSGTEMKSSANLKIKGALVEIN